MLVAGKPRCHGMMGRTLAITFSGIPFLTAPSDMRFLLVHDVSRSHEQLKSFFSDMNEILVKVRPITKMHIYI